MLTIILSSTKVYHSNNTVQLTGNVDTNVDLGGFIKMKSSLDPIKNRGMRGSIWNNSFKEMDRMAKFIGPVIYL